MKRLRSKVEFIFAVISIILYTGGPLTVILSGGVSEGDRVSLPAIDFSLVRLVFSLIYVITVALLIPIWRKAVYVLLKDKLILLLTIFTLASWLWSFLPDLTLQRNIGLVGTTLFGVYLSTRYTLKEQMRILGWALSLIIVLSFVFAIGLPKYGVMGGIHAGSWRGIYTHKNILGKTIVFSSTYFWFLIIQSKILNWKLWIAFFSSILLLILARSTSSLANFVVLIFVSSVFQTLKWRNRLAIPVILFILSLTTIVYLLVTLNLDVLLGLVGKDTTLTGRSDIWPAVLTMIGKQPWFGYGFSGFWQDIDSAGYVWKITNWTPPDAHNGLLDLLLDLGIVGFLIFLISYFICLIKSVSLIRVTKASEGIWVMTFLVCLALVNITESTLLVQNNIYWVLYVAYTLSLCRFSANPPQNFIKDIRENI